MAQPSQSRSKMDIEIQLPSIRKYVPGSGPPPPRISLAPPRDSTAYIINQFIVPTDKDMTPTSRRMIYYHIGFTDLPSVKILVPCHKVLDYVSPREVEDWEYQNLEQKEEERVRRLAEAQLAGPTKGKPGRPPKIPLEDTGVLMSESANEALLLVQQVSGPSLSTPQKRRRESDDDEAEYGVDEEGDDDDAAIQRQLQAGDFDGMEIEGQLDGDSESVDQLAADDYAQAMETPSREAALARPRQELAIHPTPKLPALKPEIPAPCSSFGTTLAPLAHNVSTSRSLHPAWTGVFNQPPHSENPESVPAEALNDSVSQGRSAWTALGGLQPNSPATPAVPLSRSKTPNSRTMTPDLAAVSASSAISTAKKRKAPPSNGKNSAHKQKKPKKPTVKSQAEPPVDEWEVKELLDDQWFVVEGVKLHKYLVLWEGDWPADQNPTWEPASNVQDPKLLNRYQKKKDAGLIKPRTKAQNTLHQYLSGAKYSSVAEAFEGGIDELAKQVDGTVDSDTDPSYETFLVTESMEGMTPSSAKPAPTPGFGSFDNMLAHYNQSFPRR
ncbi:uncharacterized protein C8A04DRAFT_11140 [Dichotomopilus funicola]|uniref:Chromo domain-containing protein n=1 Tax=Dichotomopilus funicola TaxID=1934379 RepID=A0AAN6V5S6_9PEZI|nr:hypothetical protein C8A04DRAFT_11140 [Dichotomopilus funicola]